MGEGVLIVPANAGNLCSGLSFEIVILKRVQVKIEQPTSRSHPPYRLVLLQLFGKIPLIKRSRLVYN